MSYLFSADRERQSVEAVNYSVPIDFSSKAKAAWENLPDWACIIEQEGQLIVTNETMDLYSYSEWTSVEPMPWKVKSWEELEKKLEKL